MRSDALVLVNMWKAQLAAASSLASCTDVHSRCLGPTMRDTRSLGSNPTSSRKAYAMDHKMLFFGIDPLIVKIGGARIVSRALITRISSLRFPARVLRTSLGRGVIRTETEATSLPKGCFGSVCFRFKGRLSRKTWEPPHHCALGQYAAHSPTATS